jgi:uncharacterized YigZ family protein
MSDRDYFDTLVDETRCELKISRSRFIGVAFPISTDEEFQSKLAAVQREFFDATHHCWAFRLYDAGAIRARSSDAGEPSGTAGKPIGAAIEGADLADVGCVVVRYYGGVKLGTGGLARAYRDTAQEVLGAGRRSRRYSYERFEVEVPFAALNTVYRMIDPPDVVLAEESFAEKNLFGFQVRRSVAERFASRLTAERFRFTRS